MTCLYEWETITSLPLSGTHDNEQAHLVMMLTVSWREAVTCYDCIGPARGATLRVAPAWRCLGEDIR